MFQVGAAPTPKHPRVQRSHEDHEDCGRTSLVALCFEREHDRVDAVALPRWIWSVRKDVPKVRIALCAAHFDALHA